MQNIKEPELTNGQTGRLDEDGLGDPYPKIQVTGEDVMEIECDYSQFK